jgi:hypothetical protein
MALYGDIDISREELLSCEFNDEYNIITGYRSSQFLGRKARSATMRINYKGGNAQLKADKWKNAADLGNARGLILVGNTLEGIFGISKIATIIRQEIRGVITRIVLEIQLVEDAGQKVR